MTTLKYANYSNDNNNYTTNINNSKRPSATNNICSKKWPPKKHMITITNIHSPQNMPNLPRIRKERQKKNVGKPSNIKDKCMNIIDGHSKKTTTAKNKL